MPLPSFPPRAKLLICSGWNNLSVAVILTTFVRRSQSEAGLAEVFTDPHKNSKMKTQRPLKYTLTAMYGAIGGFYYSCQGVYDPVKLCSSLACNEKKEAWPRPSKKPKWSCTFTRPGVTMRSTASSLLRRPSSRDN